MNTSHFLIILTGKTASGKDTVMAELQQKFPDLKRVVTTTSRAIREGEQNGVDYNFISEADFRQRIENKEFIEYVEYSGNMYGTEKSQILDNLDKDLIWRIDPSRAGQIREFIKNTFDSSLAEDLLRKVLVIYLTVDDGAILKRLADRGLSEEESKRRMQEDSRFWQEYQHNYDFVVENRPGHLEETVDKIVNIIGNHYSKPADEMS